MNNWRRVVSIFLRHEFPDNENNHHKREHTDCKILKFPGSDRSDRFRPIIAILGLAVLAWSFDLVKIPDSNPSPTPDPSAPTGPADPAIPKPTGATLAAVQPIRDLAASEPSKTTALMAGYFRDFRSVLSRETRPLTLQQFVQWHQSNLQSLMQQRGLPAGTYGEMIDAAILTCVGDVPTLAVGSGATRKKLLDTLAGLSWAFDV